MSKDYARVLNEVLKEITPKSGEKKNLVSLAKGAVYIAKKESAKFKGKPMLAGSLTRDTWLPGKKEFDVFILFPPKLDVKKMEKFGLEIGKNVIKKMNGTFVIEYAQHPYVSGNVQGARIDIVPAFEIKSTKELKSAVDRTPFHVRYIEKRLSKKSAKEVRLLKQFCNANGLYGADAKTEGFSGYVCELLIVKYKKFMEVLENASEWEPGAVIDLENQHSKSEYGKPEVSVEGNTREAFIYEDYTKKVSIISVKVKDAIVKKQFEIKSSEKQGLSVEVLPIYLKRMKQEYEFLSKTERFLYFRVEMEKTVVAKLNLLPQKIESPINVVLELTQKYPGFSELLHLLSDQFPTTAMQRFLFSGWLLP